MPQVKSVAKAKHAAGATTAIANAIAVARDVVGESIITIIDAVAIIQRVVDQVHNAGWGNTQWKNRRLDTQPSEYLAGGILSEVHT